MEKFILGKPIIVGKLINSFKKLKYSQIFRR
jgi:hypothetical protein